MLNPGNGEAPEYVAARIRRALAEDPRTAELGIQVTVKGEHVYLCGSVASQHCKEELDRVAHEKEPTLTVHNDVDVVEAGEPGEPEVLR
ncbi:phospholipid-binding protein [Prauserella sp. PE36]|uniref:BON domain-containing protein n=1 Tax=Prauserella endophytica TaxID=1592324 RepID=A0ABY2S3W1_9PSEU|nr:MULTISPECIES: BON domain-containing protein [Prauserella]PXY23523.1 phospholipid-binding protein [Prauserella coralliicola]RBM18367.1 phospholipid-binding protein [Prauserella sp. PE36]TKG70488.1 BON domain-containing protein [Prauserella endophytica]